jgi:hypothetical protein
MLRFDRLTLLYLRDHHLRAVLAPLRRTWRMWICLKLLELYVSQCGPSADRDPKRVRDKQVKNGLKVQINGIQSRVFVECVGGLGNRGRGGENG